MLAGSLAKIYCSVSLKGQGFKNLFDPGQLLLSTAASTTSQCKAEREPVWHDMTRASTPPPRYIEGVM